MRTDADKPAAKKRYRNVEAIIWRNAKADNDGFWYSVEYVRHYRDGDDYKTARSFSGEQNLVVGRLAAWAFEKTAQLEAQDYAATHQGEAA